MAVGSFAPAYLKQDRTFQRAYLRQFLSYLDAGFTIVILVALAIRIMYWMSLNIYYSSQQPHTSIPSNHVQTPHALPPPSVLWCSHPD